MLLRGMLFILLRLSMIKDFTEANQRLEERRKVKGAAYYERKKAIRRQLSEAQKNAGVDEKVKMQLAEFGY